MKVSLLSNKTKQTSKQFEEVKFACEKTSDFCNSQVSDNSIESKIKQSLLTIVFLASHVLLNTQIASAQGGGYSYSWGDSRVINSNQSGLVHPSGSYIGSGTMSQSAKGFYGLGAQTNPALPRVNMGANVATPGDNMYGNNPTRVNSGNPMNGGGSNPSLPAARLGANVGTAGDAIRSDLNGQAQGRREVFRPHYIIQYQPVIIQSQEPQMTPTRMAPGGVATYDDVPIKQRINY